MSASAPQRISPPPPAPVTPRQIPLRELFRRSGWALVQPGAALRAIRDEERVPVGRLLGLLTVWGGVYAVLHMRTVGHSWLWRLPYGFVIWFEFLLLSPTIWLVGAWGLWQLARLARHPVSRSRCEIAALPLWLAWAHMPLVDLVHLAGVQVWSVPWQVGSLRVFLLGHASWMTAFPLIIWLLTAALRDVVGLTRWPALWRILLATGLLAAARLVVEPSIDVLYELLSRRQVPLTSTWPIALVLTASLAGLTGRWHLRRRTVTRHTIAALAMLWGLLGSARPCEAVLRVWDAEGGAYVTASVGTNWCDYTNNQNDDEVPLTGDQIFFGAIGISNCSPGNTAPTWDISINPSVWNINSVGFSSTVTLATALTVTSTFTISANTFNGAGFTTTVTGLTTVSGGTYTQGSAQHNLNGGLTVSSGTYTQSTGAIAFGIGTADLTVSGGTFNGGSSTILGNDATLTSGTLRSTSSTYTLSGNWAKSGGTFNPNSGTVVFGAASGTQTLNSGGTDASSDFNNLTHNAAGTLRTVTNNLVVGGALTNSAGTFDTDTNDQTVTVTGLTTVSGGTYLASSSATQTFTGGLTISGGTFTGSSGTVDVNSTLTLSSGTLTAPSGSFLLSGNWSKSGGTFTAGSNTVTFDLASGTQTVFDSTVTASFNNLVHSGAGTLQMFATHLSVAGAFTNSAGTYDPANGATTVGGLMTVSGGTYLATAANAQTFNGGLTVSGGTLTGSSGAIDVNGALTFSSGTLTAPSGSFTVSGNWARTGGTFTEGSGTVTFDGASGTQTLNSGGSGGEFENIVHSGAGTLQLVTNALATDGTFTNSAGTFDMDTNDLAFTATGLTTVSGGTFTGSSSAAATFNGGLTISGGTFTGAGGAVDVNGAFTLSSGAFTAPSGACTISGNVTVSGTPTFTEGTNTITLDGGDATIDVNASETFYDLVLAPSAGATKTVAASDTLNVSNSLTLTDGNLNQATVPAGGTINLTGDLVHGAGFDGGTGTLLISGSTTNSVTLIAGGQLPTVTLNNANFTITGAASGTVTFDGLLTAQAGTVTLGAGTVSLDGGLTVNGGTVTGSSGAVTSAGTVTLSSGTLTAPSGTFTVSSGNWTQSGGTFTHNAGTVEFSGSGTQTLNSGGSTFSAVTHSGSGTLQLTTNALTAAGAFTNSAGTYDANALATTVTGLTTVSGGTYLASSATQTFNGGLTVSGGTVTGSTGTVDVTNVTLSAGTLTAPSGSFLVSGNWARSGGTFTPGANTVTFDGTGTQTVNAGGSAFNDLRHTGSGTLQLVTTDATVSGTLTNTTGTVDVNGRTLTVPGTITNSATITENGGAIVHAATSVTLTDSAGTAVTTYSSGDSVYITLVDEDANLNGAAADTLTGTLTLTATNTGDVLTINATTCTSGGTNYTLTETGAATETFRNATGITLAIGSATPGDCLLQASGGTDTLTVAYTDAQDSSDNAASDTASSLLATASTTAFTDTSGTSVDTYLLGSTTTGTLFVTVTDTDENSSSSTAQTVTATITSSGTSDTVTATLAETGPDTATFRNATGIAFSVDAAATAGNARLETQDGATWTARYTDDDDSTDVTTDTATVTASAGMILLTTAVNRTTAQIGQTVIATVTATNRTAETLGGVNVRLALPAGFGYRPGTATLDGAALADPAGTNVRTFTVGTLTAGQTRTLVFQLLVSSTAAPGPHTATLQATVE